MSGSNLPYHLRLSKNLERSLFIEFLSKIQMKIDISKYQYIGFGAVHMEDFKSLHASFNINKMTSIEYDENTYKRQLFNKPLGCIELLNCTSADFIDDFHPSIEEKTIIWLDYASPDIGQQLIEFKNIINKLGENDICKITLNANPTTLDNEEAKNAILAKKKHIRLELFKEKAHEFYPLSILPDDMTRAKYPNVLMQALKLSAESSLQEDTDFSFKPVTSFVYQDSSHPMLTLTGIKVRENNNPLDDNGAISDWDVFNPNWCNPINLLLPDLTTREKQLIDQNLPLQENININALFEYYFDKKPTDSSKMLENYSKYYRHYPTFNKVIN
ncbi:O-methyltransferase [Bacillus sp. Marseille-P3800]|uniref:O-methyltransferase n=1 Tax=Bacillus sp. Marseille-P3800 TaxID=2014782 RepID=UPI000C06A12D|nr:O-methyltransferase [Bacillus sp. Marseille-P3800]